MTGCKCITLVLSIIFFLHGASALVFDGVTLLSLMEHWTFVPPIINSSWNASDSIPCSWIGVQCDHAHHVVSLNLTHHGVYGQLGPEIGKMYHLQILVLLGNGFSGKVPSELGNCSLLEYLDLSENKFTGQIPHSLKMLQNLHYMSMSSNFLSGGIPDSLFQIAPLGEVSLHSNPLSGPIPINIGNLTQLLRLYLYGNHLSGTIPSSIGNCSKLEVLDLSFNRLTGEIPVSVWSIPSLKHILLDNNSLFGELPLEMTKLKNLQTVSLFDNQFSGVIPESLGINSSLVKLDFMSNKFTGIVPPNLCYGRQLRALNMGSNQLHGGIPSDVGRCASLSRLSLNENNFTGSLPDFVSCLNLTYMDISKNRNSGPIPSSLENCTSLAEINLSMNKFIGVIPSELGKLVNLEILDLADNNLEGPLPPQLSNCTKMDRFDVGFNYLNGSLPSSLRSWKVITALSLRENHFTGGIPRILSELKTLRDLQLGGNLFGGKIPGSLGKLQNLFYGLNLSANGLTGDIPSEMRRLQLLQSLDLSLNNLTGSIDVLQSLVSLIEVNISYNFFSGSVPEQLMKLLNSSPSSFEGNNLLCVSCPPSGGLSCIRTSYLKPCVYKSIDHRGISKFQILMIELGSSIFISFMLLIIIRMYLSRRSTMETPNVSLGRWSFIERGGGGIGFIYAKEVEISDEKNSSTLHDRVLEATNNLNDQYIIGRGAHGIVYKAQLGPQLFFAVKKIAFERNKKCVNVMRKEIQALGMIKHRNLITYADYWIGRDYGLVLYEYMQNGSLHDILHEKNPPPPLTWKVRFKIAFGIAQGLEYLHHDCNPPILHRDIKPKNILLDADMEPHIADFGTALLRDLSEHSYSHSQARQRLSTCVVGTPGYIAPEGAYEIKPSRKCDVYSYGVVLLELITRRKVLVPSLNDEKQVTHLVSWARSLWMETGKIENIADSYLASGFVNLAVAKQVTAVFLLALQCTERDVRKRPTMRELREVMGYYQRDIFKWRRDDVFYNYNEVAADIAPQPYIPLSIFVLPDIPVVNGESSMAANLSQHTFDAATESEDSNDFSFWEEANQFQQGWYDWDHWELLSRPTTAIDGLVIKLIGNSKIQAEQVVVAALIVPKITYAWPCLIFLPSVIGPVLTKPFNWFFLTRLAQYMHLQKSLDSHPKSYFGFTNQDHSSTK